MLILSLVCFIFDMVIEKENKMAFGENFRRTNSGRLDYRCKPNSHTKSGALYRKKSK